MYVVVSQTRYITSCEEECTFDICVVSCMHHPIDRSHGAKWKTTAEPVWVSVPKMLRFDAIVVVSTAGITQGRVDVSKEVVGCWLGLLFYWTILGMGRSLP